MGYIGAGPTRFNTADDLTVTGDAEFNGNLTVKGTTTTIDSALVQTIDLGDNDKIRLGDSDDLQIYHDGSNSYIIDNGTGDLVINTNGNAISLNPNGGGEYGLRVINNGAVNLYHDNSLKLATTATGVDVTGAISSNKGSAGTLATFTDGVNSNFVVETSSLLTTIGNGGGSAALAFKANNTEAMRIDSSGNVGIGVTPASKLHVNGSFRQTGATAPFEWTVNAGATDYYKLNSVGYSDNIIVATAAGNVGIGGTTASTSGFVRSLNLEGSDVALQLRQTTTNTSWEIGNDNTGLFRILNNGSDKLDITSSGNVGIGMSSPSELLHIRNASGDAAVRIQGNTRTFNIQQNNYGLRFVDVDAGSAERMRIDAAGALLVNTTSRTGTSNFVVAADAVNANPMSVVNTRTTAASDYAILFYRAGSIVGSVQTSLTATSYVTSSDYRLKENVTADWDATTRLKQLNPVRFNFIADADTTVDGFLAHEVQDVVPEAITGTKDGMRDEEYEVTPAVLDDDGNEVTPAVMGTRSVPEYQGIDQSKLVPLLVKTIQELEARIAALETA